MQVKKSELMVTVCQQKKGTWQSVTFSGISMCKNSWFLSVRYFIKKGQAQSLESLSSNFFWKRTVSLWSWSDSQWLKTAEWRRPLSVSFVDNFWGLHYGLILWLLSIFSWILLFPLMWCSYFISWTSFFSFHPYLPGWKFLNANWQLISGKDKFN